MMQQSGLTGLQRLLVRATSIGALSATILLATTLPSFSQATPKPYRIQNGPLDNALAAFSTASGIDVLYDADATDGLLSRGISGTYLPDVALANILAGTGLSHRFTGANSVVLQAARSTIVTTNIASQDDDLLAAEIIVSGERVERSIFETPSSVVVLSGEELERNTAIRDVEDALDQVPNITVVGQESGAPTVRGVATTGPLVGVNGFIGGTIPRAVVAVDGRVLNNFEYTTGSTSVFDVERIEVFRGPQTTSQGINAIAGAFQVVTADPTFEPEIRLLAEAGSFDSKRIAAAISGPLIEDELALRVTVDISERESFLSFAGRLPGLGFDPDRYFQSTIRAKLLWEPESLPALSTKLTFSRTESEEPERTRALAPFSNLIVEDPNSGVFSNEAITLIHDVSYDISDYVSVSNQFSITDFDGARIDQPGFGNATIDRHEVLNESLLTFSALDDRLSGLFGVNYRYDTEESAIDIGPGMFEDTRISLGIFGEATYDITDSLDVTFGLRYQYDSQDRNGQLFLPIDFDENFEAFLPRFAVGYDVTDTVRVGALVSRGSNPGGTTASFTTGLQDTFDQESVWNYEAFMRGRFMEGRLGIEANAFYSDFRDYQIDTTIGFDAFGFPIVEFDNIDKARSYGFELSVNAKPIDDLTMFGSLGLLKTEIQEFPASADQTVIGNELPRAPNFTFSAGVDYEVIENLTLGGRVRYSSSFFTDKENGAAFKSDAYFVADLRASYAYEGIEAFAYVNNVTDRIYALDPFFGSSTVGIPREFGAGVRVEF